MYTNVEAKNVLFQQKDTLTTPTIHTLWKTASALENTEKREELLSYLETHLKNVKPKSEKDSLDVADLYYYQFQGNYSTGNYLESLNSIKKGLPFCETISSKRAQNIKGALHYKKAYGESALNFSKRAINSMKMAIEYLPDDYNANLNYLVDAHIFLSSQAAYHGNLADAKRYIRLANNTYQNHRKYLDKARLDRYEVVLAYREAYLFYKLAKTKEDSLELTNVVKKLNKLQASPKFNKHEYIYYSTAMNHVGDWYISHKADSLTNEADLKLGNYYLDKSIDLIENKGYPGNPIVFKYNKCKALTKANELQKAEALIIDLLNVMSPTDSRKPFFLAQKALIKAKLQQKDSALSIFHTVIENIHIGEDTLTKNYSNFKPSKSFGEAKLVRRVAEKLNDFYKDDPEVKKTISKLYYLAFIQFENSYVRTKFNPKQNDLLRQIIEGILATKEGSEVAHISTNELLTETETIMNQMTWQQFYQNRYTNKLPALDSLQTRHLKLRTLLATATRKDQIRQKDSIQELINKHVAFTNQKFPNLELLSSKKFGVSELQRNLKPDELVLKYILLNKKIAIFSITSDAVKYELQPWLSEETTSVEAVVNSVKNRTYNQTIAAFLGTKLLPTIDEKIKKIIINPDGELYKIPFEILQRNNQFLTENYQIRYTSNLRFIHIENNQKSKEKSLVAIYAPNYGENEIEMKFATRNTSSVLKGAKNEAEEIGKMFPSQIYSGKNVSKNQFLKTAPEAGILHLAMHAEINNVTPGLSKLLFNNDNVDDENLYLEELYALQLNANLAVLSACNTGVGKENASRSMESFQRAFTFAGVPATVVSLWEVPDQSTSEIMQGFYQYLKIGNSKSEALTKSKLDYYKLHTGTKLAQPYYWAGFVIYGDESAVSLATYNYFWIIFISCGILLFSIGFLLLRKAKKRAV